MDSFLQNNAIIAIGFFCENNYFLGKEKEYNTKTLQYLPYVGSIDKAIEYSTTNQTHFGSTSILVRPDPSPGPGYPGPKRVQNDPKIALFTIFGGQKYTHFSHFTA